MPPRPHRHDAARDGDVLGPEHRPRRDRRFDLRQPRVDAVAFRDELVRPFVVVQIGELVAARLEPFGLRPLGVGRNPRRGMYSPEPRRRVPFEVEARLRPLPARAQLLRRRVQLLVRQPPQQRLVFEPRVALAGRREQVAIHRAPGRLVSRDADEPPQPALRRNPALRQRLLHPPRRQGVAVVARLRPHRELALAVLRHRKRLQRLQIDLPGAAGVEQFRRDAAQPQAALHRPFRNPETRRDRRDRRAGVGQRAERLHLVRRVHRHPDDVLRQRQLVRRRLGVHHPARNRQVGGHRPLARQVPERGQTPPAGHHRVARRAVRAGLHRPRHQVLQEPVRRQRRLQLRMRRVARRRAARVLRRRRQPIQRDTLDVANNLRHRCLRPWETARTADCLPTVRASPVPRPAPPPAGATRATRRPPARRRTRDDGGASAAAARATPDRTIRADRSCPRRCPGHPPSCAARPPRDAAARRSPPLSASTTPTAPPTVWRAGAPEPRKRPRHDAIAPSERASAA